MVRLGIHFAYAGIRFAGSLPLLAISLIIAGLAAAGATARSRIRRQRPASAIRPTSWSADQFAFEDAIQAYEDLIAEFVGRRS